MKLHRIELQNLNSLYGEHRIDLDKDLGDAPLFMILGPTGAGKSTILDAICLALFGQTPRLHHRRGHAHTDARLIMSQGTGSCGATVDFSRETLQGRKRYRARWSCRRARSSPVGRFQAVERSLFELTDDGASIELVGSKTPKTVQQEQFSQILDGMTVEDFKRSMLLAQGEFAAFIQASQVERAAILERLTSTEIYSTITQRAAAQLSAAETRRLALETEARASALMSLDAFEALRSEHRAAQQSAKEARAALEQATTELNWWQRRRELQHRHESATAQLTQAGAELHNRRQDMVRLEEDERCRAAEALLKVWRRLRGEHDRLSHEVQELLTARDGQRLQVQEATGLRDKARGELQKVEAEVAQGRKALSEARGLRQSHRRAEDEHRMSRMAHLDAQERTKHADSVAGRANDRLEEAIARRAKRLKQAERVAHLEPLTRELAGLREKHRNLTRHVAHITERRASRDIDQRKLNTLERDSARAQAQLDEARRALQPFLEARQEALDRLGDALSGEEDAQVAKERLRRAMERIDERRAALLDWERKGHELEAMEKERARSATALEELSAERQRLVVQRSELEQERLKLNERLEQEREHLIDLRLARSLSQERQRLKPERPCPLCGSLEHPYREDAQEQDATDLRLTQRHDALVKVVEELVTQERAMERELQATTTQDAHLQAQLQNHQRLLEGLQERHLRLEQERQECLLSAQLEPHIDTEAFDSALESLGAQRRQLEAAVRDLAAGQSLLQTCEQTLREGERAVETLSSSIETLGAKLEASQEAVERQNQDILRLEVEVEEATAEIRGLLGAHDIPIPISVEGVPNLGAAVEEATRLMGQFLDRRNALGTAETVCEQCSADAIRANERLQAAEERLKERQKALDERAALVEALTLKVKEHPYASHPARFELEFEEKLHAAREVFEVVRAETELLERRLEKTTTLHAEHASRLSQVQERMVVHRQTLTEELGELDVEDIESLSGALLSPMEREKLTRERHQLYESRRNAELSLKMIGQELDAHDEVRPAGMDLLALSTDALTRSVERLQTSLDESLQRQAKAQAAIDEEHRRAEGHQALQQRLMTATEEAERWRAMTDLVAGRGGDALRRFAQILNLQELLTSANQHLTWLAPRYSLQIARDTKGRAELNFVVLDAHHSTQPRPLTTLSGGETFLVSLSMALSLSNHRAASSPIETLLLDEGVGTLDQKSLDTVMAALERLQSDGAQIGIISHIDSLKDRIQARIVVEPMGSGRSTLRFDAPTAQTHIA